MRYTDFFLYFPMITAGCFTLLGIFIGACLNYYFSNRRNKKERILNEFNALREVFIPILLQIEKSEIANATFIASELAKQERSLLSFSLNLKGKINARFNQKRTEYKTKMEEYNKLCFTALCQAMGWEALPHQESDRIKKEIYRLIQELLEIAEGRDARVTS